MVGKMIRNMRLRNGMTQEELGDKIIYAHNTISSYERENSHITMETFLQIVDACNYDIKLCDRRSSKEYTLEEVLSDRDL